MSTYVAKPAELNRKWYVIDAEDLILGRLASEIATILRGKHKPQYTPFIDTGDYVIVVNADKVALSGRKLDQKLYRYHTQYPGGLKEVKYRDLMNKRPEKVIELAVKGMLPKNALGRAMFKKLKVYAGPDHGHAAQQPEVLTLSLS